MTIRPSRSGRHRPLARCAIIATAWTALFVNQANAPLALASDPPSGTLSPTSQPVTWNGTAIGTGALDPLACVEGVNCDTFTLTVLGLPTDWSNKVITVEVEWDNNLNDYDLYIYKDTTAGTPIAVSGGGTPQNNEAAAIEPAIDGVGVYKVRVVYFATTPGLDQPRGRARVGDDKAIYLKGGITFGPNHTVSAPVAERDGEPSSRCDIFGNYYIAGIRGVPAGVDLWYFDLKPNSPTFDPFMRNGIYRGQPDSFTQDEANAVGADGGGDVDLAVGFGNGPNGVPTVAFTSLVAANISSAVSNDLGQTWTLNPLGNATGGIPVDDRQWIEFFGTNTVYLLYRTLQPAVTQIQRSDDGGLNYGPARTVGQIGQVGSIDVDKNDGTVYVAGSRGMVGVGIPATPGAEPLFYTAYAVAEDPAGVASIFFVVRVADDGTVYACYSNGTTVFLKHSTDKGRTWSPAIRVNDGQETRTALLPWLETGPTPGSVAVVWYGADADGNIDAANWHVFMAQSMNAKSSVPTFRQVRVSDHYIHAGVISTGGTLGDANRNLLDYFQVCFDPTGAAIVGWTDDHNDFDGFTFVSRQIGGPSVKDGKKLKKQKEGDALPPAQPFSTDGAHVVDFENDVSIGLLVVTPHESALDIQSIKYSSEVVNGELNVVAQMKVKDLSTRTPNQNWRMNFAANVPFTGLNATGTYSNGLVDRGDKFYMRAFTDAAGLEGFAWGTAVRNSDGTHTYTQLGTTTGAFDIANNTVTVRVPVSALNGFVTMGPIGSGSVLAGFRGQAYTSGSGSIVRDSTRGGLEYVIP